ncbi:MAG: hypothetical protein JWN86_2598 [Planctomycetota bacterium]|nr:hypothetical protein [Planctomycetota bacterium]
MPKPSLCDFCGEELDLGQEFLSRVEEEEFLTGSESIREHSAWTPSSVLPARLCEACRESIEENRRELAEDDALGAETARRMVRIWIAGVIFVLGFVAVVSLVASLR